jgi:hypothetical protein
VRYLQLELWSVALKIVDGHARSSCGVQDFDRAHVAQLDSPVLRAARDATTLKPEKCLISQHDQALDPVGHEGGGERAATLP